MKKLLGLLGIIFIICGLAAGTGMAYGTWAGFKIIFFICFGLAGASLLGNLLWPKE